jgi:hypothetical protein
MEGTFPLECSYVQYPLSVYKEDAITL